MVEMLALSIHGDKMDILQSSLHNASQQAYISELLSFSLDRLHKEPELLRVDAEKIQRQMQDLAFTHHRAFISAAKALQDVGEELSTVEKHLDSLIAKIPELTGGCNQFMECGQQVLEKRSLNQMLLANHSSILDLLEIPQLMDTCVRNGNYDEALDLETFVSKLATLHTKLPVIQSLVADVKQITQSMLLQLLQRLRSNIQLPECLRVIGYLRRLGVFKEDEIRLQFLRCRDTWLAGMIDDLDQGNAYDYLKRIADIHRINLFDVVTQYRAIFTDDTSGNEERYDRGLLYTWAMHRITLHIGILQNLLPRITDGMSLATLLEQCMYCGMSLGRVGMDFRGLLPPLFEASVQNLFFSNIAAAVENFQQALHSHRWISLPSVGTGIRGVTDGVDNIAPPYVLMEHPPLATFVNGILLSMNELRHCAPLSLKGVLASRLKQALHSVSDYLYYFNSSSRLTKDGETSLFMAMCRTFIEVACPYCISCFQRCYPGSIIDTTEVLENLQQYVFTTSFPASRSNGVLTVAFSSTPPTESTVNSYAEVSLANGEGEHEENAADVLVNESNTTNKTTNGIVFDNGTNIRNLSQL